jgi:Ca-activated chloride channel family protein
MTLRARQDRQLIRTGYRSNRYVLVDVEAPAAERSTERPPLNTAFVLDRSGSMTGAKLDLARQAIDASIGSLSAMDRFAVVAYDDRVDVLTESTPATAGARERARSALAEIDARASTNLFEGWMRGCEQVAGHQQGGTMNRVLLMSDGLANVGVTDREELVGHAGELSRRGVATWTFGFGKDFDEDLMDRLAHAGGGQSFYVESPRQIRDFVTHAVGEALDVVAREVTLRVEAPHGVHVEPLSLLRSHRQGQATIVELGDLVSEQRLRVAVRLNFPFGSAAERIGVRLSVADRDRVLTGPDASLEWAYADHRSNDAQQRDGEVDREVARLFAARARKAAAEHNKRGEYGLAHDALIGVARRIRGYAGDDPELLALVRSLEQDQVRVSAPMAAHSVKEMHYQSSYAQRGRDTLGRAVKAPARPR